MFEFESLLISVQAAKKKKMFSRISVFPSSSVADVNEHTRVRARAP